MRRLACDARDQHRVQRENALKPNHPAETMGAFDSAAAAAPLRMTGKDLFQKV
jgi:hypothetical protein